VSRQEWRQWIQGQAATRCLSTSRLHYRRKCVLGGQRFSCRTSLDILWFERCWIYLRGRSQIPGPLENPFICSLLFVLATSARNSGHLVGGIGALPILASNLCGGAICGFLGGVFGCLDCQARTRNRNSLPVPGKWCRFRRSTQHSYNRLASCGF